MKAQIIRMDDGNIQINIDDVDDFEQAAAISETLIQRLQQFGLKIQASSLPEQHKPDVRHAHIVSHARGTVSH